MSELIILGTASAVPSELQDNTHMVLIGEERIVLIDTSTNPIVRLRQAGVDPLNLTDVILTHFHPDHVSGFSVLLMDSWLLGRTKPITIYGLAYTLERIEKMMELYGWEYWPNFFPVNLVNLPEEELTSVIDSEAVKIFASPVHHLIPNIGLRIEFPLEGKVFAYSCDTEPIPEVARLAAGADILLHEATGAQRGHSSAAQAGTIARQAEAGKLLLIHYDSNGENFGRLVEQAQSTFYGPVELAQDLMKIKF